MEQASISEERLREIAGEIRRLQAEAKSGRKATLAYLLDMAAMEAEVGVRRLRHDAPPPTRGTFP